MSEQLSELNRLSGIERLEIFESDFRELLAQAAEFRSDMDLRSAAQTTPPKQLTSLLRRVWGAASVQTWLVMENGKSLLAAVDDAQERPLNDALLPSGTADDATLRLLEIAADRGSIMWIDANLEHLNRMLGAFLVSNHGTIVFMLCFDALLPLHRDALLNGFASSLEILNRYSQSLWQPSQNLPNRSHLNVDILAFDLMKQRRILRDSIGRRLETLVGTRLDSLSANQNLARSIQQMLDENGLRLECPTCGYPAVLRCLKTGNCASGSFVFDHRIDGRRTMHGGKSELPRLVVVDKTSGQAKTAVAN